MSLVFNMVGGSGGISENRAVLVARVPAGSTVTATKGGVTLTPKMWVVEADPTQDIALFVIAPSLFDSVNPWTVTATLGTETASDTVIIDDNKEYDVVLSFNLYVIHNGVYGTRPLVKYSGTDDVAGEGYRIYKTPGSSDTVYYTDAQIDLTDYATARIVLTGGVWNYKLNFGFTATKKGYQESNMFEIAGTSLSGRTISEPTNVDIDVRNVIGSAWFGFGVPWSNSVSSPDYGKGGFKTTDIYLMR